MNQSTAVAHSRRFFIWALSVAGGGMLLAVVVRLVPSEPVHTAGLMFIPLLVPVAAVLAIIAIVFGVIALVKMGRRSAEARVGVIVSVAGSAVLVLAIPVLVLVTQIVLALLSGV